MIKIFFISNKKNGYVGGWLLTLPRDQMTRLSRIFGVWLTYYVPVQKLMSFCPVLINFMTPSKHLSIAYQGINLRRLLRFFFLRKAPHASVCLCVHPLNKDVSQAIIGTFFQCVLQKMVGW